MVRTAVHQLLRVRPQRYLSWTIAVLVVTSAHAHADPDPSWRTGDHLTGEWGGVRSELSDHGVSFDLVYAAEAFASHGGAESGSSLLGHIDVAVTLDTHKLGLWPGGKLYVLGQNSVGTGIDRYVGSATQVSNLEADPYTQIAEWFIEQQLAGDKLRIRVGKQDANRDFGTPRFGGNFLNNNFGMYPTTPLPSYPTNGLGVAISSQPAEWLAGTVAIYEGAPVVGGLGIDSAFRSGGGHTLALGVGVTRHYGPAERDEGTTSIAAWRQTGQFAEIGGTRSFDTDAGFFVQHDEHIYAHPGDAHDPSGLTVIARFGWAQADRTNLSRFMDLSIAWHGLGTRNDDTVGGGVGYFTVAQPMDGSGRPGYEMFGEAFYKWRLTPFVSLQPDLEIYRHPDVDGADAVLFGARLKLKL